MLFLNLLPLSFLLMLHNAASFREYSKQDLANLRDQVKDVFYHAYNGYLNHAFPYDELRPLSCDGIDTWGSYSLTLIDALDTLAIMGNYSEFSRVVDLITERANFDVNINVSVFETNIRIVGGLLSAHLLSEKAGLKLEPGWPCNGPLLRLAEDVAKRLLPAFDTVTGMPYGTVNLRSGVPLGETPVTCTAGVGTFIVEFGTLSRLTGDPVYEEVALHALRSLYKRRSNIGLFGNHIDTKTGIWTAQDSGIGAGVDSYFEYLVKGAILFQRPELLAMFNEIRGPIEKYLKRDDWYMWVSMHKGQFTLPVFQSLEAFWPGVLSLVGDVNGAMKSLHNYHQVWKQYGFLPEFYNIVNSEVSTNRESYPLRPELAESVMYLYRATGDPYLLDVGEDILLSIEHSARTPCGYATIRNVVDHSQEDRMESFFLAETTKYLYLLFDTENFIHNDGSRGKVFETDAGKLCVLGAGGYVFNTEAHPIDQSALHCCSDEKLGDMNVEIRRRDMKREREVETKEEEIKGNDATEADEKGKELSEKGDQDVDNTSVQNEGIENDNGLLHEDIKITRIPTTEAVYKSDATFGNAQSNTKLKENVAEPSLLEEIQERLAQLGNRKEENSNEKNGNYKSSNIGNAQSSNINDELSNGGNIQLQNSENELSNRGKRRKKRAIEENTRALNTSDQISSEDIRKNNNPPSPKKRNQSAPEKLTENQMSKEKFTEDQIASEVITKSQQSSTRELLDALFNDTLHIINEEMTGVELLDGSNMQKALLAFTIKMHAKQKKITAILSENLAEVERGLLNLTGDRLERLEKMEKHQARLDSFNIDQKRQAGIVTMFGEKMRQIQIRAMELQGVSPEESAHRVDKRQRDMDKVVAGEGNQGFDFGPKVLFPEDLLRNFNISVKSSMPSPPGEDNGTLEDDRAAPPPDLGVQKPEGNQPFKSSLVQDTQNDGYAVQENQEESESSIKIDVKKAFDRDSTDGKNPTDGFSAAENQNRISESGKGENDEVSAENDEVPAENETDECAGLENDSLRLCQLANRPPPLVFNPQTLYAKIKSQESAHSSVCVRHASHALLTCSPQSFFTRWSLRGEFFDPPESNKQP